METGSLSLDVVIDRTFGSAEKFGRTSTVRFGPNDRTFFCRTQNFFVLHSMPMASFHTFVLLNDQHVIIVIGKIAKRMSTEPKLE